MILIINEEGAALNISALPELTTIHGGEGTGHIAASGPDGAQYIIPGLTVESLYKTISGNWGPHCMGRSLMLHHNWRRIRS